MVGAGGGGSLSVLPPLPLDPADVDLATATLAAIVVLAVIDLWVGIANDAANFLNSAFGSRVARRGTILAVAAVGVLLGALTSNGLMEVARRGVFDPSWFVDDAGLLNLDAILAIYLGVMAADVLLLDLFNSIGLPTSTTVSIISELVGASLAVALWTTPGGLSAAAGVINVGPVFGIYTGIFLSVVVAFVTSAVVMFLVRLVYSHDFERTFSRWGWLWTGFAFASLAYFVVYKGLRSSGLVSAPLLERLSANLLPALAAVFVLAGAGGMIFRARPRAVLGFIILVGTGALGLAFAGNDLVNFIGPSVAAAQAVLLPGVDLAGRVSTPWWILVLAGTIMVTALTVSQKSRRVRDTEVRLAARGDSRQRFSGGPLTRAVVLLARGLFAVRLVLPEGIRRVADRRTAPPRAAGGEAPYDLLRASVNLVVASLLISLGTANGLPLSTTYITFMCAMGAALGDRVWSADSVEGRVAGILTVLGGWLVTGLIAASGAFLIASILSLGGGAGVLATLVLVTIGLWRLARVRPALAPVVD